MKNYIDEIEKQILPQILDSDRENKLRDYQAEDRVVPFAEHQDIAEQEKKRAVFSTEMDQLEKMTKGFLAGKLWVVSATTGTGKTTFLRTLHYDFAKKNIGCLWFSYEESIGELIEKFPSTPSGGAPLQHIARNLQWLEDRVIEGKLKYNYQIVFIDHLHYLIPFVSGMNQSSLIGGMMRELHEMAIRHNVLIFLVAHTSMIKTDRTPTIADLRDSSFVGQEADGVIVLYRKSKDGVMDQQTTVSVQKNRRVGGTLGSFKCEFKNGILEEIKNSENVPVPEETLSLPKFNNYDN